MAFPKRLFPNPQGNQLVNYNFADVAAATGYMTYYAGTTSGANILSNVPFYSENLNTNYPISELFYSKAIDKDFDVLFNTPQNIRGDAIIEIPCGVKQISGTGSAAQLFILAKIRKWDGSTETEIASGSSSLWTTGAILVGNWNYKMRTAKVKIPATHFRRGEYLRMTIEVWASSAVVNLNQVIIGHDPMNRASNDGESYNDIFASGASILKLKLPLKIEV